MGKKYFITNNDNDEDDQDTNYCSDILTSLLVLIFIMAVIYAIFNYFLKYNINTHTIVIISIIILLCYEILS